MTLPHNDARVLGVRILSALDALYERSCDNDTLTHADGKNALRKLLAREQTERTRAERAEAALESISRYVSWCNHGEADRGTTLDKIDEIASRALSAREPGKENAE